MICRSTVLGSFPLAPIPESHGNVGPPLSVRLARVDNIVSGRRNFAPGTHPSHAILYCDILRQARKQLCIGSVYAWFECQSLRNNVLPLWHVLVEICIKVPRVNGLCQQD